MEKVRCIFCKEVNREFEIRVLEKFKSLKKNGTFYCYELVDTRNLNEDKIESVVMSGFYDGKGVGHRYRNHFQDAVNYPYNSSKKLDKIRSIWIDKAKVMIVKPITDVDETTALFVEKILIEFKNGIPSTNVEPGEINSMYFEFTAQERECLAIYFWLRMLVFIKIKREIYYASLSNNNVEFI